MSAYVIQLVHVAEVWRLQLIHTIITGVGKLQKHIEILKTGNDNGEGENEKEGDNGTAVELRPRDRDEVMSVVEYEVEEKKKENQRIERNE